MLDISTKIDPFTSEVLTLVSKITDTLNMDFFVIGATARDIVFNLIHGIKIQRGTNDIDFSVRVRNWDDFKKLTNALIDNNFSPSKIVHRFTYKSIPSIDIIPFGEVSLDSSSIRWPDKEAKEMSILGFEECFLDSESVRIQTNPQIDIKFASTRGLVLMKLISWKDGFPTRSRDALDIQYIIKNYIEAGNMERLQSEHNDLVNDQFDFELTGAILLGRDIAEISTPQTLEFLINILVEEIKNGGNSKFISDMMIGANIISQRDEKIKHYTNLLNNLLIGLKNKL
ncbi:MAG: nucleotidyl transferase AbiEii/AbiGii toxin family protein [Ignavibacteriales bacterium]|nr:nucleotidyl transferase AbiEii/AbiGii toxin family protein [Ignavibacteriales bacterium]